MEKRVPLADLNHFARNVLAAVLMTEPREGAALITLSGELGSGKTTLVQELARTVGVEEPVGSPTYVLMKSYPIAYKGFTSLVHIDAYRLEKPEEFDALNPQEFLGDPHALVCVEWPERLAGKLPEPAVALKFSSEGAAENERLIDLQ